MKKYLSLGVALSISICVTASAAPKNLLNEENKVAFAEQVLSLDDENGHFSLEEGFAKTYDQYFSHVTYSGWSDKGGLMGTSMCGSADKYAATVGRNQNNGSKFYLDLTAMNVERHKLDLKDKKAVLTYSKPLNDLVDLEASLGLARLDVCGKIDYDGIVTLGAKFKF